MKVAAAAAEVGATANAANNAQVRCRILKPASTFAEKGTISLVYPYGDQNEILEIFVFLDARNRL